MPEPQQSPGDPRDQLPLTVPVYQILLSLVGTELHGYAIIRDIRDRTGGEVTLTASTLYAAIGRLVAGGLIAELRDRPADDPDPRRRYYRITDFGRAVVRAEAERLERQAAHARAKNVLPPLAERS